MELSYTQTVLTSSAGLERPGTSLSDSARSPAATTLTVVVPVYNDWESFLELLKQLGITGGQFGFALRVIAVDDGSNDRFHFRSLSQEQTHGLQELTIVELAANMGHQRALAIGLCTALAESDSEYFALMDADGEDRPEALGMLLQAARSAGNAIVVAQRARRSESFAFRAFYKAYKLAFRLLTGKVITFGNFSVFSRQEAQRLSMVPDLWNNLPAAMMRSRVPIRPVPVDRGRRYFGSSKMSFVSLALHGISAYSVYTDAILVRLLVATFAMTVAGAAISAIVIFLRLFTQYATPGWATTVVLGVGIIVSQAAFTALTSALILLNARSQRSLLPAVEYKMFIRVIRRLTGQEA